MSFWRERCASNRRDAACERMTGKRRSFSTLAKWLRSPRASAPLRPHTLLIQPPTPPASKLAPQPLGCKMASFESIGSCSLDAYATASEASEVGVYDDLASEKTLRSEPLSVASPPTKLSVGALTPEYVKRTALLFETPSSSAKTSPSKLSTAAPPSVVLTNGTDGDGLVNGSSGKKPSYLGLACSISGYSGITTYDSKLREGFRSRDHSPGRLGLVRSRDVSPLRPEGGPESLPACFKSECGNYLVAPVKFRAVEKSISLSGSPIRVPDSDRLQTYVNGGDIGDKLKNLKLGSPQTNGTMDETDKSSAPLANGISNAKMDSERKVFELNAHESFSDATSHIRESSRNFMSSMLNSTFPTQYESSSVKSKELYTVPSLKGSPVTSQSHDAISTAIKSDSKDSLSPPVAMSPQKRSPGAVRVVEFTSQPKSYVRTVVSSRSLFMTSASVDSALPPPQGPVATGDQSEGCNPSSNSVSETTLGSVNGNASKSFIQQRVERLYGPGALAQGFFRRTRQAPRLHDYSSPIPDASSTLNGPTSISSSSLPVLRHLRPEFRAQLSLTTSAGRRLQFEGLESTAVKTEAMVLPTTLQEQVSVESMTESLPDLQPAAPEVVLPPEQTELVEAVTVEQAKEKDGYYFLKLLKQEIDRLNDLVQSAEELLACGECLPEEALGKLRAASGQARLLVRQKLQQFEGLCHKNIAQSPSEPFPTTNLDLQGFWDMVYLQVDHVHRLFEEIERLKKANWVEETVERADIPDGPAATPKRRSGSKRAPAKATANEESRKNTEAARKAREEARRQMMEERRRAMREKKNQADSVEIFIPHENAQGSIV